MINIYLAGHNQKESKALAELLCQKEPSRFTITAKWLDMTFNPTSTHTDEEKEEIADTDVADVGRSDVLVLMAGPEKYSGGKFVETGIALGQKKPVVVYGRRENMLLWHHNIIQVDTESDLIDVLVALDQQIGR